MTDHTAKWLLKVDLDIAKAYIEHLKTENRRLRRRAGIFKDPPHPNVLITIELPGKLRNQTLRFSFADPPRISTREQVEELYGKGSPWVGVAVSYLERFGG